MGFLTLGCSFLTKDLWVTKAQTSYFLPKTTQSVKLFQNAAVGLFLRVFGQEGRKRILAFSCTNQ